MGLAKENNGAFMWFHDETITRLLLWWWQLSCCCPLLAIIAPPVRERHTVSEREREREPHLEDILLSRQGVGLSAHGEGDDRQRGDLVTAHHVLKRHRRYADHYQTRFHKLLPSAGHVHPVKLVLRRPFYRQNTWGKRRQWVGGWSEVFRPASAITSL